MLEAIPIGRETGVAADGLGDLERVAEALPQPLRPDRDDHVLVGRAERLVRHDRRVRVAQLRRALPGCEERAGDVREPGKLAVQQGDVDELPLAGRRTRQQRGEDAHRSVHAASRVRQREWDSESGRFPARRSAPSAPTGPVPRRRNRPGPHPARSCRTR